MSATQLNREADENSRCIWMVSREYGDLAGAGGVKDVVRQLAETLAARPGFEVSVVIPAYGFIDLDQEGFEEVPDPVAPVSPLVLDVAMDYQDSERWEACRFALATLQGVNLYLVQADRFSEKQSVYTYTDADAGGESWRRAGMGHYDYFAMNVLLQKSALELMVALGVRPAVVHCHDGHAGLLPAMVREMPGWRSYFRSTGCLLTIHNAGLGYHQEVADLPFARAITGLPWRVVMGNLLDDKFDPLLCAGQYGLVNTVSENYARELQYTDQDGRTGWVGHTLLEKGVEIEGVTNGIAPELFNPADGAELGLPAGFDPGDPGDDLEGKTECKARLYSILQSSVVSDTIDQYGQLEEVDGVPLFAFIGRLNMQKGVDHLLDCVDFFAESGQGQLLVLGSGGELEEAGVIAATEKKRLKGNVCFLRGYDPSLASLAYAASDFFVIPSRFEPCGLTDYIAQLFGSIPVVHQVGGLVKVKDGVTGLGYLDGSAEGLLRTLERARMLYGNEEELRRMQVRAVENIRKNHSWDVVVNRYLALYDRAEKTITSLQPR